MTDQPQQAVGLPPVDSGNPFVATFPPLPAAWAGDIVSTPQGQFARVTLRTPDATLTLKLQREDVANLRAWLAEVERQMSGLVLAAPAVPAAFLKAARS